MKADQYGTPAEQRRFKQGYQPPSKVVTLGNEERCRCRGCKHVAVSENLKNFRCKLGDFAVAGSGSCDRREWENGGAADELSK